MSIAALFFVHTPLSNSAQEVFCLVGDINSKYDFEVNREYEISFYGKLGTTADIVVWGPYLNGEFGEWGTARGFKRVDLTENWQRFSYFFVADRTITRNVYIEFASSESCYYGFQVTPKELVSFTPPQTRTTKEYFGHHKVKGYFGDDYWGWPSDAGLTTGWIRHWWCGDRNSNGEFDYFKGDAWANEAQKRGEKLLCVMGEKVADPLVSDEEIVAEYTKIATHYKGKVSYYEGQNEWDTFDSFLVSDPTLSGKARVTDWAQNAVRSQCLMYNTIKSVDPSVTILSGSFTYDNNQEYLDEFLRQGGDSCVDVYSYHAYGHGTTKKYSPDDTDSFRIHWWNFFEKLRDYGVQKPVWNTEGGIDNYTNVLTCEGLQSEWCDNTRFVQSIYGNTPLESRDAEIIKLLIFNRALGANATAIYSLDTEDFNIMDGPDEINNAGRGFQTASRWLLGNTLGSFQLQENGDIFIPITLQSYSNSSDGLVTGYLIWNQRGEQKLFRIPKEWGITEIENKRRERTSALNGFLAISGEPQLLIARPQREVIEGRDGIAPATGIVFSPTGGGEEITDTVQSEVSRADAVNGNTESEHILSGTSLIRTGG